MQIPGEQAADTDLLDRMREGRARNARLELRWDSIEPLDSSPPSYDWAEVDAAAGRMRARGLSPVGLIYGRPGWAASDDCGPVDLVPLTRYQSFVTALVERFDGDGIDDAPGSPRIELWEIENEPDFDPTVGGFEHRGSCFGGARAGDYGGLLRAAYLAIKAEDPSATVIFGGLAYDRFHNRPGFTATGPIDYLFAGNVLWSTYLAHGGEADWPFFDWMGVHLANERRNDWDGSPPYQQELRAKLDHLRQYQLLESGYFDLRDRPLAITEIGLASAPSDGSFVRSEDLQAIYPARSMARAMAEDVPIALWHTAKDDRRGDCATPSDWLTFGLLRSLEVYTAAFGCPANPLPGYFTLADNEPKPVLKAFAVAQEQLGGYVFDQALGTAVTGDPRIEAYRFLDPDTAAAVIVVFTDNGEPLGRRGFPAVQSFMIFRSSILPGWTGSLDVTDHLGGSRTYIGGSAVLIRVDQNPLFVRPK